MLSRRILINMVVFLLVSAGLVAYGILDLFGNPVAHRTRIATVVPASSGLVPRLTVTSNGMEVGRVTSVHLVPNGVRVDMSLNPGVTIPSNVTAKITRANPIGEQAVALVPRSTPAPPLANGAMVPAASDAVPPDVGRVLQLTNRILAAVPHHSLQVLVHQLALTLQGSAPALRSLTSTTDQYSREFLHYQAQFKALLANSPPVLNTLAADGPQLRQALTNTAVLVGIVDQHRNQIVNLWQNGGRLGDLLGPFVAQERPNVACILHDFGDLQANLAQPANLSTLNAMLQANPAFFGIVNRVAPMGPAKAVGPGTVSRPNQVWLRELLMLPPPQPQGQAYVPHRGVVPTLPGAGCITDFGPGAGPATEANPTPPAPGGRVIPPSHQEALVMGRHLYGGSSSGQQQASAHEPAPAWGAVMGAGLATVGGALALGLASPATRRRRVRLAASAGAGIRAATVGRWRRGGESANEETK